MQSNLSRHLVCIAIILALFAVCQIHAAELSPTEKALEMAKQLTGQKGEPSSSATSDNQSGLSGEQANLAQKGSEAEPTSQEQAVFPGIKNELFKLGGESSPSVNINYPFLNNPKVDSVIRDFVEKTGRAYIKDLNETYSDEEEKPANYDQWEMLGFFTADRPNPDIISITFSISSYTGGAHGDLFVNVMNYDLKTGKEITLADMFADPQKAIELFSQGSPAKLRAALGEGDIEEEMLSDGTAPTDTNFAQFALNPNGLAVEFQPYQVGPWSIGQQHVDFTLDELMPAGPNPAIWPNLSKDNK